MPPKRVAPDFEIQQYIDTFRISSDRVRVVLYILVAACFIIASLEWNTREGSWPRQRLEYWRLMHQTKTLHEFDRAAPKPPPGGRAAGAVERIHRRRDVETVLDADHFALQDEYAKQFIDRLGLVTIPLFGTSFDINDLGVVGGVILALLELLLLFCVARQHENLYLCAFKVRRLREDDEEYEAGDSDANFLYHALVMTQVLNHPPTLARWSTGAGARALAAGRLITFWLPTIAYAFVIMGDIASLDVVSPVSSEMLVQYTLLVMITVENFFAFLYLSACQQKWIGMFYDINPRLEYTRHGSWFHWIDWQLGRGPSAPEKTLLAKMTTSTDRVSTPVERGEAWATHTIRVNGTTITKEGREQMARGLFRRVRRSAFGVRLADAPLIRFLTPSVEQSVIDENCWTVRVRWPFEKAPRADRAWHIADARENSGKPWQRVLPELG
jgi:hypothetical protein